MSEQSAPTTPVQEMSFMDHLTELRKRILLAVVGVAVGCVITGVFSDEIMRYFLLYPAAHTSPPIKLINLKPYGYLTIYMQVILITGLIVALPWVLLQFWLFVAPGLHPRERRWIRWITFFTTFCFVAGLAFAFFIVLPYMLSFFAAFTPSDILENQWSISEYLSTVIGAIISGGIVFELPMAAYFLGRLGILTPPFMRHYYRHAIVVIVIAAAIITPTPDPLTCALFALPLMLLYEVSIHVVALARRQRDRKAADTSV
jgi:sec-independent protein translocase protein TatC